MGIRGDSIKKTIWISVLTAFVIALSSCSSNEVIRVGVPFTDGSTQDVLFKKDIKDPVSVGTLRTILHNETEYEELEQLSIEPQAVFTIDRIEDGETEVRRFVWYRDNGRAILSNERNVINPKDGQQFYRLSTKETNDLKEILQ